MMTAFYLALLFLGALISGPFWMHYERRCEADRREWEARRREWQEQRMRHGARR